jgi:type II secretory pathway pseudopilin PulG
MSARKDLLEIFLTAHNDYSFMAEKGEVMKKRKGQSLIEVTVAVLISAVTATGIFSVILSTKYSHTRADTRESAAIVFRGAQEYLKPYVSVAAYDSSYAATFLPNNNIYGENVWALSTGRHYMNFILKNMPQFNGAELYYDVSRANCNSNSDTDALECRNVVFYLSIPE